MWAGEGPRAEIGAGNAARVVMLGEASPRSLSEVLASKGKGGVNEMKDRGNDNQSRRVVVRTYMASGLYRRPGNSAHASCHCTCQGCSHSRRHKPIPGPLIKR